MQDHVRNAYSELVKQHARAPHHRGAPDEVRVSVRASNPVCGDRVEVFIAPGDDPAHIEVHFDGRACAICVASASMMTRALSGGTARDAAAHAAHMVCALEHPEEHELPEGTGMSEEELEALDAARALKARRRCASLPWQAVRDAIELLEASHEESSRSVG